jgi:hypothetical protein
MGAQDFYIRQRANSPEEAFTLAVEEAIEENGNDIYNGTVSTCHGFSDVTQMFRKGSLNKEEFIHNMLNRAGKRDCFIIEDAAPVKNTNKIKSVVEHNVIKGTSKWELRYNVYSQLRNTVIMSYKTKAEAVEFARKHTEKTQNPTFVRMEKILTNQDSVVARIKYKQSSQEKEGMYTIFGYAAH